MASTNIMVLVSLFLIPLAFNSLAADYDVDTPFHGLPKKSVVIEGIVYCQSCEKVGTSSLSEADPIPSAVVSVTCINHNNRIFYYKKYIANENGYFHAKLEGFSMDHMLLDHPLASCKVKLVSSPMESCEFPTNINSGTTGAPLRYEHKRLVTRNSDTVFYAGGPLAFRPNDHCKADGTRY